MQKSDESGFKRLEYRECYKYELYVCLGGEFEESEHERLGYRKRKIYAGYVLELSQSEKH